MVATTALLDRLLDPVSSALSFDSARKLVGLRADAEIQQRVDALAQGANDGTLNSEERSEYEALVAAATVIGVLQAKARAMLDDTQNG